MTKAKYTRRLSSSMLRAVPLATALSLMGLCGSVWANDILVNDLSDPGLPGDARCSLREAVGNAAGDSDSSGGDCVAGFGADLIKFSLSGTITLGSTLAVGDASGQTLDGAGQKVVLDGNNAVRVLRVAAGSVVSLRNLTVANGFITGNGFIPGTGAGIANSGTLTVINSTFAGNRTAAGRGGAIANQNDTLAATGSSLTLVNSTLTGNQAANGGAIDNAFSSVVTVLNSTIARNSALTPAPQPCVELCTQSIVIADGGGIANAGTLNLGNSLIAGNLLDTIPSDLSGLPVAAGSSNLIGDAATAGGLKSGVGGNIVGADVATVIAQALANNGGSTATLALLPGSVALDNADAANCPATDQRGVARPQGSGCDIGAFEQVVVSAADLAISMTALPNPVVVQDRLTLSIGVNNRGPSAPSAVKVAVTLPASGLKSITAVSLQGSCGAPVNGVITCSLGGVASGGSATVSVSAIPTAVQTLTSTATVSSGLVDNQTANNSVTRTISVQPLLCNGLVPTIVGTPSGDVLTGTSGRDVIHGLGGNDTLRGMGNNDVICGGEGQDTISGGDGYDIISGGNGNDILFGDYGNDSLNGDAGNDSLNGGFGTDICNGSTGTDSGVNCEGRAGFP